MPFDMEADDRCLARSGVDDADRTELRFPTPVGGNAETGLGGGVPAAGTGTPSGDVESTEGGSAQQNQGGFELCPFTAPDSPNLPLVTGREQGTGRFATGNKAAAKHNLFGARLSELQAEERREFYERSLADDGGIDQPERRRSLHEYRADLHTRIRSLSAGLEHFGTFDRQGRLRERWITKLESLMRTALAVDQLLGLDRRAKSATDELHAAVEASERARQGGSR